MVGRTQNEGRGHGWRCFGSKSKKGDKTGGSFDVIKMKECSSRAPREKAGVTACRGG